MIRLGGALLALVLIGAGCSSSSEETVAPVPVPPDRACTGGETQPIQVSELVRVFRKHGLQMFDDPECGEVTIQRRASNAPQFGAGAPLSDYDDVKQTQGYINCDLLALPVNPLQPVERIKYEGDEETQFRFGNVLCFIYPHPDSEREQVERLRRAAADLARVADKG